MAFKMASSILYEQSETDEESELESDDHKQENDVLQSDEESNLEEEITQNNLAIDSCASFFKKILSGVLDDEPKSNKRLKKG